MSEEEETQARRRRVSKACVSCRQKKSRCDGQTPTCSACATGEIDCVYPQYQNRRGAGKSKQYIKTLEELLAKAESTIQRLSGQKEDADNTCEPACDASLSEIATSTHTSPASKDVDEPQSLPSNHISSTLSSKLTLFTQNMDQLNKHRAAEYSTHFRRMIASPIMPRGSEITLVNQSIADVCGEFPLFQAGWLSSRVERGQPTIGDGARADASWWASFNAVIAMAVHVRTANSSFQEVTGFAWAYFKNAYDVFPELFIQGKDLAAVQAVVAMAMFARSSADARTTPLILSTAIRLSQTLDLHRRSHCGSRHDCEIEDRRRVLWTAFILDTELSLYCGLPSMQSLMDIEVGLPTADFLHEEDCLTSDEVTSNAFKWRAELAMIQSMVRIRLYAANSRHLPNHQLRETVSEIDVMLEVWRSKVPRKFQPGLDNVPSHDIGIVPVAVGILQLAFYNLVSMVHWSIRRHSVTNYPIRDSETDLSLEILSVSPVRVRAAARASILLIQQMDLQNVALFWRCMCYPLAAATTLLLCVLESPKDPEALADAALLGGFVSMLRKIHCHGGFDVERLLRWYLGIERLVNAAVEEAGIVQQVMAADDQQLHRSLRGANDQTAVSLLGSLTHPMYLAQNMLTNVVNCDADVSWLIAITLGVPREGNTLYGPLVPESLKSATYGFSFDPSCTE